MYLLQASALPAEIDSKGIAEEALQAAFALIAERLEGYGYPVTGDFAPDEAQRLEDLFVSFVCSMALNNPQIAALNDEDADEDDEHAPHCRAEAGDLTFDPERCPYCADRLSRAGMRPPWCEEDLDPRCYNCGKALDEYDLKSTDPNRCDSCATQARYDALSASPPDEALYSVSGIQACEPRMLSVPEHGVRVDKDGDCQGFDTVRVSGPSAEVVLGYIRENWGDDDADWFAEYIVARMEGPTEDGVIAALERRHPEAARVTRETLPDGTVTYSVWAHPLASDPWLVYGPDDIPAPQPTVYLVIGPSAIALSEKGEVLETVDWNADGTPDWKDAGICDHRGGGGEEGFRALVTALEAAEVNARSIGQPIARVKD